jgi:hypothetical protein
VDGIRLFVALAVGSAVLLAAVVVAGFLYEAVGLWATVIWAIALVAALAVVFSRRSRSEP